MHLDTRAQAKRLLGVFTRSEFNAVGKTLLALLLALAVVLGPQLAGSDLYAGLGVEGQTTLGILVLAAGLWMTEAMPAFAVGLLVIGLQIALVGLPAEDPRGWTRYVEPWAQPTMWLFLGGFVMAHACSKTGLDEWLARGLLGRVRKSPAALLALMMGLTFVFSMFMSNTATAAMMLAVIAPVLHVLGAESRMARGLVLAVAVAANLGGIGTVIGTPPNALVAVQLPGDQALDFLQWMKLTLPPAVVMGVVGYGLIWVTWLRGEKAPVLFEKGAEGEEVSPRLHRQRVLVMSVFALTIFLWMTGSIWSLPASVVSFIPIVVFSVLGVIESRDMRELPWDVLLFLAGGLSLGVGMQQSGLATWLAGFVPEGLGAFQLALAFAVISVVLSNLMSNTATAAMLVPLAAGMCPDSQERVVMLSIAVACSAAMLLPVSTPPNAIAYGSQRLRTWDFFLPGAVMGGLALLLPWWFAWVS